MIFEIIEIENEIEEIEYCDVCDGAMEITEDNDTDRICTC